MSEGASEAVKVARVATKSDWMVRDSFIKMLVNVIEALGDPRAAYEFTLDFLGKLYRDALHTIAVYEVKKILEGRGAKCIVTFFRNPLVDLVVIGNRIHFVEVKSGRPPWGGNNIREFLAYKASPSPMRDKVIYVWREGRRWRYAPLRDVVLDISVVRAVRSYPLDELDI